MEGQGAPKNNQGTVQNVGEKEWIQDIKRLWTIKMENSEFRKKLVDSMPRRLEEVIERQGASTKY